MELRDERKRATSLAAGTGRRPHRRHYPFHCPPLTSAQIAERIEALARENRKIHERDCFNLNPATNVMNPRAEALLASGLGSRPSLGHPGDKYEMGLEAIEEIEVIAANLAREIFQRRLC
ncbi:hypothetical protein QW131_03060 [Roseibium salinum]|nr:hypothetical protein [Roseibium salinum]